MFYTVHYFSPAGELILVSDEAALAGAWFTGQKYFAATVHGETQEDPNHPVLCAARQWLDDYFAGNRPNPLSLPLAPQGGEFRQLIWQLLLEIPYGQVVTYGQLAKEAARRMGKARMSSQAVGGAVGHNPISIIIPCHRVVGASGSLTGYASGLEKKTALLRHEGVDFSRLFSPKKGTAL